MVKRENQAESEPVALRWTWRPETTNDTVQLGKGHVAASHLLDQKVINDISDYLWYMTR